MNLNQETDASVRELLLESDTTSADQVASGVSRFLESLEDQIQNSIDYLDSDDAERSIKIDPYWPKWHSPWWHMTALHELGLAKRIPSKGLELFVEGIDRYLHFFPFTEADVPNDRDPISDVICICALATAERVLRASGVDVDSRLPWLREWFTNYQLPDGGYNCDEAAYAKNGKSSMISTIHMMESMLERLQQGLLNEPERACLDKSAAYVIERRLIRSISKNGELMDPLWCELTFPRFYELDILRAIRCIVSWATLREKQLPWSAIVETVRLLDAKMRANGSLGVERDFYTSCRTRLPLADGTWLKKRPVSVFPLLTEVSRMGHASCPLLTKSWLETLQLLRAADQRGLVTE